MIERNRELVVIEELAAYHARNGETPWAFDPSLENAVGRIGGIRKVDRRENPLHGGICGDALAITVDPFPFLGEQRNRAMVVAVDVKLPGESSMTRFVTSFDKVARSTLRDSSGHNYPVLLDDWLPIAFKVGNVLYMPPPNALQCLAQMAFAGGAREVVGDGKDKSEVFYSVGQAEPVGDCDLTRPEVHVREDVVSDEEAHLRRVAAMHIKRYLALPGLLRANEAARARLSEEHGKLSVEFSKLSAIYGQFNK